MQFNRSNTKKYKRRKRIALTYKCNGNVNTLVGKISTLGEFYILFKTLGEDREHPIRYEKILNIKEPEKEKPTK